MSRILLAEDNDAGREFLREVLEGEGHEVVETINGQQVLDELAKNRPDLLLLDIQMPVLSGYEVVRRLREDPGLAGLKVVALTAFVMRGDREKVLQAGFDGYLAKPIDLGELRKEVRKFLDQSDQPQGSA